MTEVFTEAKWKFWKHRRYVVAIMGFLGSGSIYSFRTSLSVAIVAMTQTTRSNNGTMILGPDFNWDSKDQGLILSSFFYGYIWTQILGGILAGRFGGNIVFGCGMLGSSVLYLLSPLMASLGFYPFMANRILSGLFEGVTYPSIQDVLSRWTPTYERTTISGFVFSGSQIGTLVSFLVSGFLAQHIGWQSLFYVFGGFGCLWFALWMIFIKRDPASDPRISTEERQYIQSNLGHQSSRMCNRIPAKIRPPWGSIITSKAVYANITVAICEMWCSHIFLTQTPMFLRDILKYDIRTTGVLAASPYLVSIIIVPIVGLLSDHLRSRKILSTQNVRKIGVAVGLVTSALFMITTVNITNFTGIYICLVLSIGMLTISKVSRVANLLDFAPNYASVVMGIGSTLSSVSGIVGPALAGFIVRNGTQEEWRIVFYIAAGLCLFGTVVYVVFGQGEIQEWNNNDSGNLLRASKCGESRC